MPDNQVSHAVIVDRLERLSEEFSEFRKENKDAMKVLKTEIDSIKRDASYWKGGFIAIVSLGGIISWLLDVWSLIRK